MPLAAGENAIGEAAFAELDRVARRSPWSSPISRSGAASRAWPRVIDRIAAAGLRYCPHYLGGGIGLLASAHLLAARGRADGWLEVDSNENPLRTLLCPPLATPRQRPDDAAGRRPGSASSPTSRPCARSAPEPRSPAGERAAAVSARRAARARRLPTRRTSTTTEPPTMDSINANQPEDNREDLSGNRTRSSRIREVVKKSASCFFCTAVSRGSGGARPMSVQEVDDDGKPLVPQRRRQPHQPRARREPGGAPVLPGLPSTPTS